jgi:hypothetical protein
MPLQRIPESRVMPEAPRPTTAARPDDHPPVDLGHPRGTLAIVILFGLLFGLGWIAMYVFGFLQRGAPRP